MSKQDNQDSLKKYYVTDLGIFLFNWVRVVGKVPLIKNYSFNDIISSQTIKKSYPLTSGGFLFGLFLLMIVAVWKIPQIQVPNKLSTAERERITLEDKVRTTLIQAIGGSAIFITGCFALLNYQISQKKLELDKETSEKNLELADSKQITERFSKAVEQLGNEESITVRLGGIYSLGQIAENSIEYYWIAMEVLTLFIREESNKRNEETERRTVKLSLERAEVAREEEWYHLKKIFNTTNLNSKKRRENLSYSDIVKLQDDQDAIEFARTRLSCYIIPQDIQAALTIIGQKNIETKSDDKKLNLDDSNLNGANLNDLNLNNAALLGLR